MILSASKHMCGLSNLNSGTFDNSLGRFVDDCKNLLTFEFDTFCSAYISASEFHKKGYFY